MGKGSRVAISFICEAQDVVQAYNDREGQKDVAHLGHHFWGGCPTRGGWLLQVLGEGELE
jgi:hypothetical protein